MPDDVYDPVPIEPCAACQQAIYRSGWLHPRCAHSLRRKSYRIGFRRPSSFPGGDNLVVMIDPARVA